MCGIFGVWERDGGSVDLARVQASVGAMRHRGPDDEGYLLIDSVSGRMVACGGDDTATSLGLPHIATFAGERFDLVLGHRRLAILDTSPAGHQPMVGQRCAIVHSGEVYNFERLRDRVARSWRSSSDTEVLLALFEEEGARYMNLDGMWAFAIWDPDRRSLFCSRDLFGMKPFHYSESPGRFVFASEMRAILAYTGEAARPHGQSVLDYLVWGMTDHLEEAFIDGIGVLPPGGSLWVDATRSSTSGASVGRGMPVMVEGTASDALVHELLGASVTARLLSDVPVGTCLSGGLDSSSVVALAAQARADADVEPMVAFTAVFDDGSIDERRFARAVVEATGSRWQTVAPTSARLFDSLTDLTCAQEAPFASSSVYAQWEVMRAARGAGVTVLLDGQGGDELFAGYPQHVDRWLRRLLLSGNVPRFAREARATGGIAAGLRRALRDPRTTPPPWIDAGFAAATTTPLDATWRYPRNASLSEMLEVDLRYRLPSLLRYEERNSMAHGVEARLPFLDEVLVGEAHNIEDGEKIHDGVQKAVLRRAMRGVVPDVVLDRRDKLGFSTPERAWLLAERSRVKAVVLNPSFMDAGFVDRVAVRSSLDAPDEYVDTSVWWRWLSLASWLQVYPG